MTTPDTIYQNRKPNKLANEKSPYLLQHAYNPVNWYPWGEEAFQKATEEYIPIFLSIGYSCCHWCHVHKRYNVLTTSPKCQTFLNPFISSNW